MAFSLSYRVCKYEEEVLQEVLREIEREGVSFSLIKTYSNTIKIFLIDPEDILRTCREELKDLVFTYLISSRNEKRCKEDKEIKIEENSLYLLLTNSEQTSSSFSLPFLSPPSSNFITWNVFLHGNKQR